MLSILFVEDDNTIAMGVEYSLKQDGFQVSLAYRLEEARDLLKRQPFDLVLLDLGLPDGSGYELCKEIRAAGDTPIIILSARDEEASIVLGLDLGADDYITKPFRLRELISRMKAVLRRRGPVEAGDRTLTCGDVTVFTQQVKVYKNGREVLLTALEYRLLLTLILNQGRVLTRSQILGQHLGCGRGFRQRQHANGLHQAPAREARGRPAEPGADQDRARPGLSGR